LRAIAIFYGFVCGWAWQFIYSTMNTKVMKMNQCLVNSLRACITGGRETGGVVFKDVMDYIKKAQKV